MKTAVEGGPPVRTGGEVEGLLLPGQVVGGVEGADEEVGARVLLPALRQVPLGSQVSLTGGF